eukprot:jgi/Chrzof1/6501/Cz18g13190.t1
MEARHVLRQLLRSIDRNLTSVAGNTQWRDYVLQQFRDNAHVMDSVKRQQGLQLAKDYAVLISNIAHHRELLTRYGIGLNPDARNKSMVEATAKRVGFTLPEQQQFQHFQERLKPPGSQEQQQQAHEERQLSHDVDDHEHQGNDQPNAGRQPSHGRQRQPMTDTRQQQQQQQHVHEQHSQHMHWQQSEELQQQPQQPQQQQQQQQQLEPQQPYDTEPVAAKVAAL